MYIFLRIETSNTLQRFGFVNIPLAALLNTPTLDIVVSGELQVDNLTLASVLSRHRPPVSRNGGSNNDLPSTTHLGNISVRVQLISDGGDNDNLDNSRSVVGNNYTGNRFAKQYYELELKEALVKRNQVMTKGGSNDRENPTNASPPSESSPFMTNRLIKKKTSGREFIRGEVTGSPYDPTQHESLGSRRYPYTIPMMTATPSLFNTIPMIMSPTPTPNPNPNDYGVTAITTAVSTSSTTSPLPTASTPLDVDDPLHRAMEYVPTEAPKSRKEIPLIISNSSANTLDANSRNSTHSRHVETYSGDVETSLGDVKVMAICIHDIIGLNLSLLDECYDQFKVSSSPIKPTSSTTTSTSSDYVFRICIAFKLSSR